VSLSLTIRQVVRLQHHGRSYGINGCSRSFKVIHISRHVVVVSTDVADGDATTALMIACAEENVDEVMKLFSAASDEVSVNNA